MIFLVFSMNEFAVAQEKDNDIYRITIDDINAEFATVSVKLLIFDGTLTSGGGGSYDWERGWMDFVKEFKAKTLKGDDLNTNIEGVGFESVWKINKNGMPYSGIAEVFYKVDLSYAKKEWDFGNEQAGRIYNGGFYTVTKPFFINSGLNRPSEIIFEIPSEWDISNPWSKIGENHFLAANWESLDTNFFVLGNFKSVKTLSNGFDLEVILLGEFQSAPKLVTETIEKVLPIYLDVFPKTEPTKYMMVYLSGESEDAEAFNNGAAFTTSYEIASDNSFVWADFLAHELFHFWNGRRIKAENRADASWFTEGITDYYANIALLNRGVISEEWFIRRLENIFGNYLWFQYSNLFEGMSIIDAGKDKGNNRFGIYDAGWVVAFALDNKIRTETENEKSLDDIMRAMFIRYGNGKNRYTIDELVDIATLSTGIELTSFFDQYVMSRKSIDLKTIMDEFGWESYSNVYSNEFYLTRKTNASKDQIAKWSCLIEKRFPYKN